MHTTASGRCSSLRMKPGGSAASASMTRAATGALTAPLLTPLSPSG